MRYRLIFGLAALLIACDQFTKRVVITSLPADAVIVVTDFFNLVNVRNRGAAFGFLNDPSITWQFWIFLSATLLAVGVIVFVAKGADEKDRLLFVGLGSILGGAVGNLIDRIRFREVIDFLDFHYAGWHWPAFNVADIAICVGAGLTALIMLRPAKAANSGNSAAEGGAAGEKSGKPPNTAGSGGKKSTRNKEYGK